MARKALSYFADERGRNNNPNFFINMKDEDLRRQVKRIIRDIKNMTIEEQDLNYFKADKILSACLSESYIQFKEAETLLNALTSYVNGPLAFGPLDPRINIWEERNNASNIISKVSNRLIVWRTAYYIFTEIQQGAEIHLALSNILALDKKLFYDL